jgi:hypothetical protein
VSGTAYYVDCVNGDDGALGTSPSRAWKTLDRINAAALTPGDGIFVRRGTVCAGALHPQGSGSPGRPLTLGAYGAGPAPIIVGGENAVAVLLSGQQHWHIENLEITGGTEFGLHITGGGQEGVLEHFRLTNLIVHGVHGGPLKAKESGLVVFSTGSGQTTFRDVVIENVTAYDTNQWGGIIFAGLAGDYRAKPPLLSERVTIRNSTAHDVYGDGIVLWGVRDGLIEGCVAYETGKQPPPQTIGTPNGIWTWMCHDCVVQGNEVYATHSPDKDGGAFDIDWGCERNIYQYNYAHDTDSYGIAVFGAGRLTTSDSIVRYNIFANTGMDPGKAATEGALFLSTWDGGHLDGVEIYNNTFLWSPGLNAPFLNNQAAFTGSKPNRFANNLIVSAVPWLLYTVPALAFDHNLYWHASDAPPVFMIGDRVYKGFTTYQAGSGQDMRSLFADPRLPAPNVVGTSAFIPPAGSPAIDAGTSGANSGERDFYGNRVPYGHAPDVGAAEWQGK